MANWTQACPQTPVDGSCPVPLIWIEQATRVYLTWDLFYLMLPSISLVLLTAWGLKRVLKFMLPKG